MKYRIKYIKDGKYVRTGLITLKNAEHMANYLESIWHENVTVYIDPY